MKIIHSKEDEENLKRFRCKQRAKYANKRFPNSITQTDVLNCLKRFHFRCSYCCVILKPTEWQLDHFYPKASGGLNHINNICPTCKWCNTMKNALDGWGFINKCKQIAINNLIENMIPLPKGLKDKVYKQNGFIQNELKGKSNG